MFNISCSSLSISNQIAPWMKGPVSSMSSPINVSNPLEAAIEKIREDHLPRVLFQLSSPPSTNSFEPPKVDSKHTKEKFSQRLEPRQPKVDPKYAKEEFKITPKKTSDTQTPKLDPKHKKEKLHFHKNAAKNRKIDTCFPQSGKYHKNDLVFYDKVASLSLSKFREERCAGTLYLRSEDTSYMHGRDGYLRSEDTRPIGEISDELGEKLITEGRVWYRNMEKVKDICKHIDDIHNSGGKIQRLILVGHGNPYEMLLSQKGGNSEDIFNRFFRSTAFQFSDTQQQRNLFEGFNFKFREDLFKSKPMTEGSGMDKYTLDIATRFPQKGCLKNLESKADIVLIGCSTGKKGGNRNLADAMALQAPGHRVVAPLSSLTLSDVKEKTTNGKVQLYFENSKGKDITYVAQREHGAYF